MIKERDENKEEKIRFDQNKLKTFFLSHLDKIYSAKQHLIGRLPELLAQASFADLRAAIIQTVEHVENEVSRMELMYTKLDSPPPDFNEKGLSGIVEDAFQAIKEHGSDKELRDLSILFYLQNIESLEMASFQVLQMAAVKLKDKQVATLLKENYEEAKADRTLFLLITGKYITASPE